MRVKTLAISLLVPLPLLLLGAPGIAALPLVLLALAFLLSSLGDLFLALKGDTRNFMRGLVAFLVSHLFYISVMLPLASSPETLPAKAVSLAVGVGAIALYLSLAPALGRMKLPFGAYLVAGLVMAQVGEFSFVLAKAGLGAGAIDRESYQLALSVIALSLIVSPFWLVTARRIHSLGHTMQYTGVGPVMQRIYPNAYEWGRRGRAFALEHFAALLHWLRSRR